MRSRCALVQDNFILNGGIGHEEPTVFVGLASAAQRGGLVMKSRYFRLILLSLAMVLSFSLAGYSSQASDRKQGTIIKLGTLSTIEPFIAALKDELALKGYKVEIVMFDANNMPAIATRDGDINGFIHNHRPWLETFNKETKAHLVMLKPYLAYYRTAIYSSKHKSLAQIPNGAQIAVPNDPTNLERSLLLLQELKLLSLKAKTSNFYTTLNIKENPKNIKLIETEISTTARSINDADAVICPGTRIKAAGINPNVFIAEDKLPRIFP